MGAISFYVLDKHPGRSLLAFPAKAVTVLADGQVATTILATETTKQGTIRLVPSGRSRDEKGEDGLDCANTSPRKCRAEPIKSSTTSMAILGRMCAHFPTFLFYSNMLFCCSTRYFT